MTTNAGATILAQYARATELTTAEHHPQDVHGAMKYSLHIFGGKATGTVIHCSTEQSVIRLFEDVVRHRKQGREHPYLSRI